MGRSAAVGVLFRVSGRMHVCTPYRFLVLFVLFLLHVLVHKASGLSLSVAGPKVWNSSLEFAVSAANGQL